MKRSHPRLVFAALRGGSGKTILSVGLCSAWRERGRSIVPFKKGPDYIDAAWLGLAAGMDCHHLDPYLMSWDQILGSFLRRTRSAHGAVIEGNRGLYDGVDPAGTYSTAELAKRLKAPVVLVLDATKTTRTAAAMVMGLRRFDRDVDIRGVVLNHVAGSRHEAILRESIERGTGVRVLGAMPRWEGNMLPQRHLGLVPPQEHAWRRELVSRAGELVRLHVDEETLWEIAGSAHPLPMKGTGAHRQSQGFGARYRVGVVRDEAFHFYYPENLEALEETGGELVRINALEDRRLPAIDGLYIGGGFPEVCAEALAANRSLRDEICRAAARGMPIYGECGGLIYLGKGLKIGDREYPMVGALPLVTEFLSRPQGHGYTELETVGENPFFPVGSRVKGHEFHYSRIVSMEREKVGFAFRVRRGRGIDGCNEGIVLNNVLATYTHLHALGCGQWAGGMADRIVSRIGQNIPLKGMKCGGAGVNEEFAFSTARIQNLV